MVKKEWGKTELEDNTKKIIETQVPAEIERRLTDYAKDWYSKHDKIIKHAGYDPETKDIGEIRRATEELGGFNELFEKEKFFGGKKYETVVAPLCVLAGVAAKIEKDEPLIRTDEMRAMLYLLNERASAPRERLKKEIRALPHEGEISEQELEAAVDEELKVLYEARKDIAQKITPGRNLDKEALEKGEKSYIDTAFSSMFGDFGKQDYLDYFRAAGYSVEEEIGPYPDPRRRGELISQTISVNVYNPEGNRIAHLYTPEQPLKEEDIIDCLKKIAVEKNEPDFREEWTELEPSEKDRAIKVLIKEEIEKAAKPLEMARGKGFEFWKKGPEVVYGNIKERLVKEEIEKKIKEEKGGELEKFKEAGIDAEKFFNLLTTGEDKNVKKFSGNADKDFRYARRFAEGMGLPLEEDTWKEFNEAMKKIEVPYNKKIVENPSFLLQWWINLINFIIGRQEGIEKKLEKFGTET
jgi:hypothetical protein